MVLEIKAVVNMYGGRDWEGQRDIWAAGNVIFLDLVIG